MLLAEEGQPEPLGFAGEQNPAMPGGRAALDLLHARVDVPERHRHDRDQATRVGRSPVAQEVVVGLDAGELERVVLDLQELLAAEPGDVGVEHLGPDALAVHVLQAGAGVVRRWMHVLIGGRSAGKRLRPAGKGGDPGGVDLHPIQQPDVETLVVTHHMRDVVAVLGRHPRRPHITWLGDVRVAIDDLVAHGCLPTSHCPLVIRRSRNWPSFACPRCRQRGRERNAAACRWHHSSP